MEKARKIAKEILDITGAKSVFLYGSRARDDFYNQSDYEIGVLMNKNRYFGRSELKNKFPQKEINIFPFRLEEFIAGKFDTPFQKSIYLKEIIENGITLAGEDLIHQISVPDITFFDIVQDVRFNLGYALAATHSYRNNDFATAALHFAKSCLFGTRSLVIMHRRLFPATYPEIVTTAKKLDLGPYQELPSLALNIRTRKAEINPECLFMNISFLNMFVEEEIVRDYKNNGDQILIPGTVRKTTAF